MNLPYRSRDLPPKTGPIGPFGPQGRFYARLGPFLRAGFAWVSEEAARKSGPMRPIFSGRRPVGPLGPFVSTKGADGGAASNPYAIRRIRYKQERFWLIQIQELAPVGSRRPILVPSG